MKEVLGSYTDCLIDDKANSTSQKRIKGLLTTYHSGVVLVDEVQISFGELHAIVNIDGIVH